MIDLSISNVLRNVANDVYNHKTGYAIIKTAIFTIGASIVDLGLKSSPSLGFRINPLKVGGAMMVISFAEYILIDQLARRVFNCCRANIDDYKKTQLVFKLLINVSVLYFMNPVTFTASSLLTPTTYYACPHDKMFNNNQMIRCFGG